MQSTLNFLNMLTLIHAADRVSINKVVQLLGAY